MNNWFIGGAKQDKRDKQDFRAAGLAELVTLPKEFTLDYSFKIKHQNGFPSCVAQSAAAHKQRQEGVELSARFIYSMAKNFYESRNIWGMYSRDGMKVLANFGVCEEKDYPEIHNILENEYAKLPDSIIIDKAKKHLSSSYWRIDTIEGIKQAIYKQHEAVTLAIPWFYNWLQVDYILPEPDRPISWAHQIMVKGWKKEGFEIINSWGENWGKKGRAILPYELFDHLSWFDAWVSLDVPERYPVDEKYGLSRTWQSYLLERKTAFNPWLRGKIGRLPSNREISALVYGKHDWTTVFKGYNNDVWLFKTKPQLLTEGFNYQ